MVSNAESNVNPDRETKQPRLVLCFDGTWNTSRSNTNVSRFFSLVADRALGCPHQRKFYDEGVGTRWRDRLVGGMLGMGLDENIREGYAWLSTEYPANDPLAIERDKVEAIEQDYVDHAALYFFGFSRGAFTARSLVGLVNYIGIPRIPAIETSSTGSKQLAENQTILDAWNLYQTRPLVDEDGKPLAGTEAAHKAHEERLRDFRTKYQCHYPVRIHFIGVWDTVGALGIPRVFDVDLLAPLRPSSKYRFHSTDFCRSVRWGFHAVAIDEHRRPYLATLWTKWDNRHNRGIEQRWFVGAHANVGGGYPHDLLPAPPLKWLADRGALCGLDFVNDRNEADATGTVRPYLSRAPARFDLDGTEFRAPVRDSYAEFLFGTYRVLRSIPFIGGGRVFRRMLVDTDGLEQTVDPTAFAKWQLDPGYRPTNLGQAGRRDSGASLVEDARVEAMDQAAALSGSIAGGAASGFLPPKDLLFRGPPPEGSSGVTT